MPTSRDSSQSKRLRQVKCAMCKVNINSSTEAMTCDTCIKWICIKCAEVPPSLYAELQKLDDDAFPWTCPDCKKKAPVDWKTLNNNILDLKKSNEERLSSVENKIHNLESTVKETVKKEVDCAKEEINKVVQKNLAETVSKLVDARLKEAEDQRIRGQNLIFFKVPMLNDKDSSVRKTHDQTIIKDLYKQLFPDDDDFMISTCYRLGKPKPDDDKDKDIPLKVVCASKGQRRKLLLNSKLIKDLDDENIKKVIVVRDLTVEQREANKKVREEKAAREANGENVRERHGQCVEGAPQGSPSQR